MTDILTRGVPDEVARGLRHLAVSLNVSPNQLRIWLFEEAALPFGELTDKMRQRAEEVSVSHDKKFVVYDDDDIPRPNTWTRPMKGRE